MYQVKFILKCKGEINVTMPFCDCILCGDVDRALALASMLRKISTPEVEYAEVIVEPFKSKDDEKK